MQPLTAGPPMGYRLAPLVMGTPLAAEAVKLYLAIWPGDTATITSFFAHYATLPDYHGLAALHADAVGDEGSANMQESLAGFGFGTRSLPGDWWHDKVAEHVGVEHPALQDAWCLVDLAVVAQRRSQGIGGALLEALLAAQPCPRALLSTEMANTGAQRFYQRHGWILLHPGFVFSAGDQPYVVMRRELAR